MTAMTAEERARRFRAEHGASYVANVDDLIAEHIRQAEAAAYKRGLLEQLKTAAHQDQRNFAAARKAALVEFAEYFEKKQCAVGSVDFEWGFNVARSLAVDAARRMAESEKP